MSRILKLKNKMNMKNLIKYGFIAVVICFTSCGKGRGKLNGIEVVNRKTGEIYILKHNRQDTYFIYPKMKKVIDTTYCR